MPLWQLTQQTNQQYFCVVGFFVVLVASFNATYATNKPTPQKNSQEKCDHLCVGCIALLEIYAPWQCKNVRIYSKLNTTINNGELTLDLLDVLVRLAVAVENDEWLSL